MGHWPRRIVWSTVSEQFPRSQLGGRRAAAGPYREAFDHPRYTQSERATVVTDVVILLPLLLTMIAATFMLGTSISDYMYLNQTTRELGMIMSKIPHMWELQYSGAPSSFTVDPKQPVDGQLKAAAEACIVRMSASQVGECSGQDCLCAITIAKWYASEMLRMKRLLVQGLVTVETAFNSRDLESGLCFISVSMSAERTRWAFVGGGRVRAEAHVPYVSSPVPWNGGTCVGPPS